MLEIDSMDTVADLMALQADWAPAGEHWLPHVSTKVTHSLAGVGLQTSDAPATANNWARVLGYPLSENKAGEKQIVFGDGTAVRFLPVLDGRGDGLSELDIVADKAAVMAAAKSCGLPMSENQIVLCGMRINLHE